MFKKQSQEYSKRLNVWLLTKFKYFLLITSNNTSNKHTSNNQNTSNNQKHTSTQVIIQTCQGSKINLLNKICNKALNKICHAKKRVL